MGKQESILDAICVIQAHMVGDHDRVRALVKESGGEGLAGGLLGFASGLIDTIAGLIDLTTEELIDQLLVAQQQRVMEEEDG